MQAFEPSYINDTSDSPGKDSVQTRAIVEECSVNSDGLKDTMYYVQSSAVDVSDSQQYECLHNEWKACWNVDKKESHDEVEAEVNGFSESSIRFKVFVGRWHEGTGFFSF